MTREQLVASLAQSEGNLRLLAEHETQFLQRAHVQSEALKRLEARLGDLAIELHAATARRDELQRELNQLRHTMEKTEAEGADAARLQAELAAARRANELADQLNRRLRQRLEAAEARLTQVTPVRPRKAADESQPPR